MVSINGFLVSSDRGEIGIRSYRVPGSHVTLPVRAEIAPLLVGFARDFHAHVQPLHAGWCWGYAFRPVRGGTTPSFHSAGLAIDLNAPTHPLGRRGTFKPERQRIIRQLASRYGLRWGGDYRFRADEMHFEVILNRRGALDLAATIQHRPAPKVVPAHGGAHRPEADKDGTVLQQQKRRIEYDEYRRSVALGSRTLSLALPATTSASCSGGSVCTMTATSGGVPRSECATIRRSDLSASTERSAGRRGGRWGSEPRVVRSPQSLPVAGVAIGSR